MYIKISLLSLFAYCYAAKGQKINDCAAAVSSYPLDPKSGCCGINNENKILTEFPWLALIEYDKDGVLKTLCGGALISGKYVLSAAHCVTGLLVRVGKPKNIRLGEYDTRIDPDCEENIEKAHCTNGITTIPIEKIIPHPEFESVNQRKWNDIALIRMEKIAPFTESISPICMPTSDITLRTDPISLVKAGWGQISGLSPVKLKVDLPFVNREKCQMVYSTSSRNVTLWQGQICAGGEKGKDSCKGDGGLPLMFDNNKIYEVVGIVSFGINPCGMENIPSVYTNVYEYRSWIMSNIEP